MRVTQRTWKSHLIRAARESAERRLKNVMCSAWGARALASVFPLTICARASPFARLSAPQRWVNAKMCVVRARVTWQKVGGWRASRGDICRVNDLRLLPPIFMHINEAAAAAPLIAFICSDFCFRAAPRCGGAEKRARGAPPVSSGTDSLRVCNKHYSLLRRCIN